MVNFKNVLSDWDKDIIFGLPVEKCPMFLIQYHDLLDDSYLQYFLYYLASKGQFTQEVSKLSSKDLFDIVNDMVDTPKDTKP